MARGWLVLLLAGVAAAQVVLNSPEPAPTLRVDVTLVNVYCSVRDRHGAFVRDMAKEEFEIREGGKRQPIRLFAREVDSPLTVALLLDTSGSVAPFIEAEKATAARFFREFLRPGDSALVAGFAGRVALWRDFTASPAALERALYTQAEALPKRPGRGGTLLLDAVSLVSQQKLRRRPGRKLMVVITDGLDNGSNAKIDDAIRAAQQADAVVYGIHFGEGDEGLVTLEDIAKPTGGRAWRVSTKQPLERIFAAIAEEMRSQYGLAYRPPDGAIAPGFRRLEVRTTRPGLDVRARHGYYR